MAINFCVGCELPFLNLTCSSDDQSCCLPAVCSLLCFCLLGITPANAEAFLFGRKKHLNAENGFLLIAPRYPVTLDFWPVVTDCQTFLQLL